MNPHERFAELARALRWRPDRLVAMLWAYFDESGVHDIGGTGKLDWLILGGGLTTAENWDFLTGEWNDALKSVGIKAFHMADFENYKREFEHWTVPEHALLDQLLEIQEKYVHEVFGVQIRIDHQYYRFVEGIAAVVKLKTAK